MDRELEATIIRQHELFRSIARVVENLRKRGIQRATVGAVEARLQTLQANWTKFESGHEKILRHPIGVPSDHDYLRLDLLQQAESEFVEQKGMLLEMLNELKSDSSATPAATAQPVGAPASRSMLPRLDLPHFSGNYEDWPSFHDLFYSIVGRDDSVTPVQKLQHLKAHLSGEAALLVRDLPTTDANFERAWALLDKHYRNTRLLVRSHLRNLTSLPKLKSEAAADLRRLYHAVLSSVGALESIGRPIQRGEDLLVHCIVELLDARSRREWEFSLRGSMEPPAYADLQRFLEERLHVLESLQAEQKGTDLARGSGEKPARQMRSLHAKRQEPASHQCSACSSQHPIWLCEVFRGKVAAERRRHAQVHHLCTNCLGKHPVSDCSWRRTCAVCHEKHHTLLHEAYAIASDTVRVGHLAHRRGESAPRAGTRTVLLATARVRVMDRFGQNHMARALVDQGSETSLVSEALVQRLKLRRTASTVSVIGVGGERAQCARGEVDLDLSAMKGGAALRVTALVLPRISVYTGKPRVNIQEWSHLTGLELADPDFLESDSVELLLGAEAYAAILLPGLCRGGAEEPVAQQTILGWILSGTCGRTGEPRSATTHQCQVDRGLTKLVQKFWQQEELALSSPLLTGEEVACEALYEKTTSRQANGRYVVRLPVKDPLPDLRRTRTTALRCLQHQERRWEREPGLRDAYVEFLRVYETMEHMTPQTIVKDTKGQVCYLPHHGVLRGDGSCAKLRVVFNGSSTVPSGSSLNQALMVGPNLLPPLGDILLRWRRHRYVLSTDVEKMYRQVLVHDDDRDLQRILWRYEDSDEVREYRLNTVTYGLACAPFLAMRTLRRLAADEKERFPRGAEVLSHDVYMDDILTGGDTWEEVWEVRKQLLGITRAGGFPLSKWAANEASLLHGIPADRLAQGTLRSWQPHEHHAMLGLLWHPGEDDFAFAVRDVQLPAVSKRAVLALTARLFDPLGWLAPVIIRAKIAFQATWLLSVGWDDPLDETSTLSWRRYAAELPLLESIRIPRWLETEASGRQMELHGFSDASERAYAAVMYLRVRGGDGAWRSTLLSARTKVAPLKSVSLPRLELCGALLLARLAVHVRSALSVRDVPLHLHSDSTVTLGWIRSHPTRWVTYVANRVAEIQTAVPEASWHHVPGPDNPADCASRGLAPGELRTQALWWQGPSWLREEVRAQPVCAISENEPPEGRVRAHVAAAVSGRVDEPEELLRFSSLHRLLRSTAWWRRWLPRRVVTAAPSGIAPRRRGEPLTTDELEEARLRWIRVVQAKHYGRALEALRRQQTLDRADRLNGLSPFVDAQGVLRVGGRMKHAVLAYDERHPVILPPGSHLTRLTVEACHRRSLHGGVQLTLGLVRLRYWIPRGRSIVKQVIQRCVRCVRWRAAVPQQLMGNLPRERVNPARPFQHTGVDYAGPMHLRTTRGRGGKTYKAFLAVFICLVTRAVHLEAVCDYTAEAFLAAFRRFVSRRGVCEAMYSDCGTTFVGADAKLRAMFAASSREQRRIGEQLSGDSVKWHFGPPAAPHFGGLWEAAVKSLKHHLRRVLGETRLTYEEMSTLLAEIEACLNSRPLQPLTDDPEDLAALTPGHFLVGSAVTAIPEPTMLDISFNRLSRWQLLQRLRDQFWSRWAQEYLQTLMRRGKWYKSEAEYSKGRLCLVRHENTPPGRWLLARIVRTHPGDDGLVRVVTVRTANSELVRPIVKLVLLPMEGEVCQESN